MPPARVVLNAAAPRPVPPLPAGPRAFHAALPGYAPTPLTDCPALAAAAGVKRVLIKDESDRFGLPAFKYLGASWALAQVLGGPGDLPGLAAAARERGIRRLVAATDGNHGRAVARLAAQLGLESDILVPQGMPPSTRAAIAGEGARIVAVAGDYDTAVRAAALEAADPACRVVADADLDGTSPVPAFVIDGYATLFGEVEDELARRGEHADLVLLQIGVGAFAAAGVRWAASHGAAAVGVEPSGAPCVAASLEAGGVCSIESAGTVMAGLDAGTPSRAAWPALAAGLRGVLVIEDADALAATALLRQDGVAAGPSGAAGAAGLIALAGPEATALRGLCGWHPGATAVCVATEGAEAAPEFSGP